MRSLHCQLHVLLSRFSGTCLPTAAIATIAATAHGIFVMTATAHSMHTKTHTHTALSHDTRTKAHTTTINTAHRQACTHTATMYMMSITAGITCTDGGMTREEKVKKLWGAKKDAVEKSEQPDNVFGHNRWDGAEFSRWVRDVSAERLPLYAGVNV